MADSNRFTISDYADMIEYDEKPAPMAKVEAGPSQTHRPLPSIPTPPTTAVSPAKSRPSMASSSSTSSFSHRETTPQFERRGQSVSVSPQAQVTYPPRALASDSRHANEQPDYFAARPNPSSRMTGLSERTTPMSSGSALVSPRSAMMSPRSEISILDEKDDFSDPVPQPISTPPRPPVSKNASIWDKLFPKSFSCRLLIIVVFLEAIIDIAVQANLLWRFNIEQKWASLGGDEIEQRRLPYFVGIFAAAHIVQFALTMYAIYTRNMVQILGLAIFNALLLIYAGFQIGEIATILGAATDLSEHKILTLPTKILSGVVIGVIASAQIAIAVLSWSVWKEFGWRIYRFLGADLNIRRYYLQYQVFECIACFSFFFFAGFGVQFIGMVLNKTDPEYILTIVMLPVSLVWLVIGVVAARYELVWVMSTFLVGLLGGIAYFIFKFIRIFTDSTRYVGVQKSLGVFCMLSLVMIILCLIWGGIVWNNFNKGLKKAVGGDRKRSRSKEAEDYAELGPMAPQTHRITID